MHQHMKGYFTVLLAMDELPRFGLFLEAYLLRAMSSSGMS